jgi:hypothetical protein
MHHQLSDGHGDRAGVACCSGCAANVQLESFFRTNEQNEIDNASLAGALKCVHAGRGMFHTWYASLPEIYRGSLGPKRRCGLRCHNPATEALQWRAVLNP